MNTPSHTPVPATVLTGFLGSGKTTLLNRLLAHPHGLRVAVVVNEFGAVGVDGSLVAGGEQFVELDNGCLCCALNEDLNKTLHALMARGGFDHVVIETTGMADPLPVAWSFNKPVISQYYRVDAIITVADAANLSRALEEAAEARQQLKRADLVILNKRDLIDVAALRAAEALVRQHNDLAPLFTCGAADNLPWDVLLSHGSARRGGGLTHGSQHQASFESWAYETQAKISDRKLEDLLLEVPTEVYRVKGLLHTDAPWGWTLVNVVAGRIDVRPCTPTRLPEKSGLVFIGRNLDTAFLAKLCAGLDA